MPFQVHEEVVLPASMQDAPALHLARPHGDGRFTHAVHGEEVRGCFREKRAKILNHAELVEHSLGQHEQPLPRGCDFWDISEIAFDDQRANGAARDLHVCRTMGVRMIPIGPRDMVGRYGDLDVVALARFHHAHDIVGDAARTDMQSMRMKIGGVELMRQRMVDRLGIAVGRHVVDKLDTQHIAGLQAQGWTRNGAFISPHIEPGAADIFIRVLHAQCRVELAIR